MKIHRLRLNRILWTYEGFVRRFLRDATRELKMGEIVLVSEEYHIRCMDRYEYVYIIVTQRGEIGIITQWEFANGRLFDPLEASE